MRYPIYFSGGLQILTCSFLLSTCSSDTSVNGSHEILFKHVVIDPNPNTSMDCCTDICAVVISMEMVISM